VRTKHFRDTEGQAPTWSRTSLARAARVLSPVPARRFGGKTRNQRSVRRRAKTGTSGRTQPACARGAVDHQRTTLWISHGENPRPTILKEVLGALPAADLEGDDDLRDPAEQGEEPDPEQQERSPGGERLLRGPEAEDKLQDAGHQAKPP